MHTGMIGPRMTTPCSEPSSRAREATSAGILVRNRDTGVTVSQPRFRGAGPPALPSRARTRRRRARTCAGARLARAAAFRHGVRRHARARRAGGCTGRTGRRRRRRGRPPPRALQASAGIARRGRVRPRRRRDAPGRPRAREPRRAARRRHAGRRSVACARGWPGVVAAGSGRARPSQHRDARAARRAGRGRPGAGAEDPRLSAGARRVRERRRARRDSRDRPGAARAAARARRPVTLVVRGPHALVGALCVGVASANAARLASPLLAFVSVAALLAAVFVRPGLRLPLAAAALALAGWWWGSVRLDRLDRSVLAARIGTAERALVEVDAPVTRTEYGLRAQVIVRRFGDLRLREPALLELPLGRAPPLGARLALVATVDEPRGPVHGFDERAWLRRTGVHVVLHASCWARAGSRCGVAALVDPLVPARSALLVWLAAWCAAWIALCARLVGGLPFAQIRSNRGGAALAACALLGGAYAWRRWRPSSRSI